MPVEQDHPQTVMLEPAAEAAGTEVIVEAGPQTSVKQGLGFAFWFSAVWLVLIGLMAAFAPVLPFVKDPGIDPLSGLEAKAPSGEHWFGTDELGQDVFARTMHGARLTLVISLSVVFLGIIVGGFLGVTSGYFRGRYDKFVMLLVDVMLSIPALILAIALIGSISTEVGGGDLRSVVIALSVLAVPSIGRITRASTLQFSQREFVMASRSLGAKDRRIISREILPNVIPPMMAFAFLALAVVIVAESTLGFLGLSVKDSITWGSVISSGRQVVTEFPWISLLPALVMFLTLLSFNFVGDTLQRRFAVREAGI